jgi:hypothetical protein
MKKHWHTIIGINIAAVLALVTALASHASELQVLTVSGTITSSSGRPLPGCLVSVVSEFGRSVPAFTDANGTFTLEASLPPAGSTSSRTQAFLEIYWNRTLVFRQPLESLAIADAALTNRSSDSGTNWQSLLSGGGRVVLQPTKVGK